MCRHCYILYLGRLFLCDKLQKAIIYPCEHYVSVNTNKELKKTLFFVFTLFCNGLTDEVTNKTVYGYTVTIMCKKRRNVIF